MPPVLRATCHLVQPVHHRTAIEYRLDKRPVAGVMPRRERVFALLPCMSAHNETAATLLALGHPPAPGAVIRQNPQLGAVIHLYHDHVHFRLLLRNCLHPVRQRRQDAFIVIIQNPNPFTYRRVRGKCVICRTDTDTCRVFKDDVSVQATWQVCYAFAVSFQRLRTLVRARQDFQ